jgi:alpha-aminoadipate/glutamate carrier protein LysW
MDVLRCPECSAEIDVDEDEVEEGEILSCPECETELEVSQTHPVALNPISDELEEDDEEDLDVEEEDEEDFDEDGDLLDEDEEDDEEEDE